jgi:hypothetical protein
VADGRDINALGADHLQADDQAAVEAPTASASARPALQSLRSA